MSSSDNNDHLLSRLQALASRFGFAGRESARIRERASRLYLPFRPLNLSTQNLFWEMGAPLERLNQLPRSALSGPVQEDKAFAHSTLRDLIQCRQQADQLIDLKQIDGLLRQLNPQRPATNLETYAAACKQVRIISFNDFSRTLEVALPRHSKGAKLRLLQANWRGQHLFWNSEQHLDEMACAIIYARLRGLDTPLRADIEQYKLSQTGLNTLHQRFHVLAMPSPAWSDPAFMRMLLEYHLPYSRLTLLQTDNAPEFLLLPKQDENANAFGEGLRLAGADDLTERLSALTLS